MKAWAVAKPSWRVEDMLDAVNDRRLLWRLDIAAEGEGAFAPL
jgi:hypothetical protein